MIPCLLLLVLLIPSAAPATVAISEFLARNSTSIRDEDGERSDWIELFNFGSTPVELGGWHLTDDAHQPTKWTFPPWELGPGQYLLIFASDKNRAQSGAELHANFKLSGDGEYLALIRPDGRTPATEFAPQYPPQEADIAYGLPVDSGLQRIGGAGRYLVPRDDRLGLDWLQPDFDDSAWTPGVASYGYETTSGYQDLIGTDLEAPMHLGPTSVYLRFPFDLEAPDRLLSAAFRMQYDDGFIAYLNGTRIARGNAPRQPAWNSAATAFHDDSVVRVFTPWPVDLDLLRPGTNVLAVHGLNENSESSDLLLTPQLDLLSPPRLLDGEPLYLPRPTPGADNAAGVAGLGPVIDSVSPAPGGLDPGEALIVEAQLSPRAAAIDSVQLHFRVNFAPSRTLAMADDGRAPDQTAGDGLFTGRIPAVAPGGHMLRWQVAAIDAEGHRARYPAFGPPDAAPEYLGTVVRDPNLPTDLPVLHWFVDNPEAVRTDRGTRSSVFFAGQFYDNILTRHRGLWTKSWPKPKFKFDFNPRHHFRYHPEQPRVEEFNLQSHWWEWIQTSFMRENLAYRFFAEVGIDAPLIFHLHVRQNGEFLGLFSFVEQVDETFLARRGLDATAPMYKALQDGTLAPNPNAQLYRKVNRREEDWRDLEAFTAGLSGLGGTDRTTYVYDHVDLAQIINEMAAQTLISNHDRLIKNYYVYLDPATEEWHRIPWDAEASFPLFDRLRNEHWASPLFGDNAHTQEPGHPEWINFLVDAVLDEPVLRQMYLRRLRTLMDQYLAPEQRYFEEQIATLRDSIAATAALDRVKWPHSYSLSYAVDTILSGFLPVRRDYLFAHPLIPPPQEAAPSIAIAGVETEGGPAGRYIELVNANANAVDLSGWRLTGATTLHLQPGTVIPSRRDEGPANKLYIAAHAPSFRARAQSPTGGERRFVQGNHPRLLAPQGGALTLHDAEGRLVASFTYEALGTLTDAPVINEINYRSAPDFDPGDWVEIHNPHDRPLDLSGWRLKDGNPDRAFTLPDPTVLAADGYLVLCRDQAAFAQAFPQAQPCLGDLPFGLSSSGEAVRLYSATDILADSLTYANAAPWPPQADGGGATLALKEPQLANDDPANWSPGADHGTPGRANEVLTAVLAPPQSTPAVPFLGQNYPNPFNSHTAIPFALARDERVKIALYDLTGQRLAVLVDEVRPAGYYTLSFDASHLASGLYFYRLRTGDGQQVRRMVLVR